ncbi:hypothetical protein Tco_0924594 [Tanacetum coccineum]|uniref:Reverse transcriptase domain-containing protein n=1 Tax=Tanacetum coccineum TaxID=301880 RepID=A0ABQ5D4A8_9ASTR
MRPRKVVDWQGRELDLFPDYVLDAEFLRSSHRLIGAYEISDIPRTSYFRFSLSDTHHQFILQGCDWHQLGEAYCHYKVYILSVYSLTPTGHQSHPKIHLLRVHLDYIFTFLPDHLAKGDAIIPYLLQYRNLIIGCCRFRFGNGAHTEDGIGMGVEITASDIREDGEEFKADTSAGGTMEIDVDPLVTGGISRRPRRGNDLTCDRAAETAQRQLEVAGGHGGTNQHRFGNGSAGKASEELIAQRSGLMALVTYEGKPVAAKALEAESQSQNGNDGDNGNGGKKWGNGIMEMEGNNEMGNSKWRKWNKIQKVETKLWNLTVKNNDLATYTQRFQELTLLCTRMVSKEED